MQTKVSVDLSPSLLQHCNIPPHGTPHICHQYGRMEFSPDITAGKAHLIPPGLSCKSEVITYEVVL